MAFVAVFTMLSLKPSPPFGEAITNPVISIDGKSVEMAFTDDNNGEDLIINTEAKNFFGLGGAVVPFTIQNVSGSDQNINIVISSSGNIETTYLKMLTGEKSVVISKKNFTHSTTTGEIDTIPKETVITSEWDIIKQRDTGEIADRSQFGIATKNVAGTHTKANQVFISAGETKTFKLSQRYLGDPGGDEFFIEAFGDQGGYGHLDPNDWVAVEPLDGTDNADLHGTSGGSGWSAAWSGSGQGFAFDTADPFEGTSAVDNSTSDRVILRALTTTVDTGIVKLALNNSAIDSGMYYQFRTSGGSTRFNIDSTLGVDVTDFVIRNGAETDSEEIVTNYSENTWYAFHLDFDSTAGTVRARLDADTAWSATIDMDSTGEIGQIRLVMRPSSSTSRADDIGVGSDLVVADEGFEDIIIISKH